jgi:hypothetical protein
MRKTRLLLYVIGAGPARRRAPDVRLVHGLAGFAFGYGDPSLFLISRRAVVWDGEGSDPMPLHRAWNVVLVKSKLRSDLLDLITGYNRHSRLPYRTLQNLGKGFDNVGCAVPISWSNG